MTSAWACLCRCNGRVDLVGVARAHDMELKSKLARRFLGLSRIWLRTGIGSIHDQTNNGSVRYRLV